MPRLPDFGGFTEPAILILTSLATGPAHGAYLPYAPAFIRNEYRRRLAGV